MYTGGRRPAGSGPPAAGCATRGGSPPSSSSWSAWSSSSAATCGCTPRPIRPGPPGPRSSSPCQPAAGVDQLASTLEAKGVIGSSLAYRIWSQFHPSPASLPGTYAFNKNSSFTAVDAVIAAGPNVFPLDDPARVHRGGGGRAGGPAARTRPGRTSTPWPPAGTRALALAAGGVDQPRRPARHRDLHRGARARPTASCSTDMIDRFDTQADALGLAGRSGRPRPHPLPGDHRGLHRGEGRGDRQEPGSGGPGHPQPAGTTTCRCRWTRPSSTPRAGTAAR